MANGQFYVIRHANSLYNSAWIGFDRATMSYDSINYNPELHDASLTAQGKKEIEMNRAGIWRTLPNLKYVLTSPLRRAMETTHLLFKDHPDAKSFVVVL